MKKMIIGILGIILTSIGLLFCLLYTNIFVLGYSFFDYVHFIIKRVPFYFLLMGLVCMWLYLKRKD